MIRWFVIWILGLVAVIASAFLQQALMEYRGYGEVVETVSRIGWIVLIFAVTVLVADLGAMVIYTIRKSQSDDMKGKVVTENRALSATALGVPTRMGWSRRKMLGSKSGYITMESLVDGTATFGERMMVLGINTLLVSFFLVFVGVGLMLMKELVILILFPVIPGMWLYNIARETWQEYQEAKQRIAPGSLRTHI